MPAPHHLGAANTLPLVVSPRQAAKMMNLGTSYVYELIAAGELDSYLEGRFRKITVASIERRIARLVEQSAA